MTTRRMPHKPLSSERATCEVVTLRTGQGGLVVRGRIPRFDPPVEVLQWGQRMFGRRDNGDYRG